MKNISISFFTFLNLLLLACCSKEEPCPTCFEDIVTCKVNGKEWRSNCKSNDPLFGCRAVKCYYYILDLNGLDMSATNDMDNSIISLDQFSVFGGAKLGNNIIEKREIRFANYKNKGDCIFIDSLDQSFNNYLILDKIDTINFVLEGRFSFRNFNFCLDTVLVTDGYFKTKFIF